MPHPHSSTRHKPEAKVAPISAWLMTSAVQMGAPKPSQNRRMRGTQVVNLGTAQRAQHTQLTIPSAAQHSSRRGDMAPCDEISTPGPIPKLTANGRITERSLSRPQELDSPATRTMAEPMHSTSPLEKSTPTTADETRSPVRHLDGGALQPAFGHDDPLRPGCASAGATAHFDQDPAEKGQYAQQTSENSLRQKLMGHEKRMQVYDFRGFNISPDSE